MVLRNVDVSQTVFVNAINLDQIRLEGRCRYLRTPRPDWRQNRFLHRSSRAVIGAEDMWRRNRIGAARAIRFPPDSVAFHNTRDAVAEPASIAPVYRYLRKALEDGKDEPGAADFYYGEMEMRRLDRARPQTERALIAAYWAISGYGLRASRALCALMAVMILSFTLLLIYGIPHRDSMVYTVGSISTDSATLIKPGPKLSEACRAHPSSKCSVVVTVGESVDPTAPTNAVRERITAERAGKALEVVSSVSLFNSDEQELTGLGKVICLRVTGSRRSAPRLGHPRRPEQGQALTYSPARSPRQSRPALRRQARIVALVASGSSGVQRVHLQVRGAQVREGHVRLGLSRKSHTERSTRQD